MKDMCIGRPIVLVCILVVLTPTSATDRHYYVSADEVEWSYAPSGQNKVTDDQIISAELIENRSNRIGGTYTKIIYREYTDATFSNLVVVPAWAGFVGPMIKGEIGDTLYIHFRNNAMLIQRNFSVHPHGYFYNKGNEGAVYIDGTSGVEALDDGIAPGATFTYIWEGNKLHKPDSNDFHEKCAAFTYHSHVLASRDVDSGLMGVALICNKGTLDANNKRKDVDEELFVYADITDENKSWYIEHNLQKCGNPIECTALHNDGDDDFAKSNEMAHINGYVYGNMPADFNVCEGSSVVWYFMSVQRGIHTVHINGQTMVIERKRTDTAALHPASVYSGFMTPVNPGRWLLYSRNQDYYVDGMQTFVTVEQCQTNTGVVSRNYYIAIEEVSWDYAPGIVTNNSAADVFLESGSDRIGSTYKKAMFVEYTDDTFNTPKAREQHWGLAGPPIKTQVNDHVVVKLLNKANRSFSFLVNGVAISKPNEGAIYKNNPSDSASSGSLIQPNQIRTYEFDVTEDVGPEAKNEDCITYIYHSAVNLNKDIHTGLFGPLLVCKPRTLTTDGSSIGVDKEFFLNWMVIDENLSWYIDDNIATYTSPPVNKFDEDFQLSNQMRAINGYTYGTLPGLEMSLGERTVWYMYGLGGQTDHHHFSFEGNNFNFDSRQFDTTSVFPGTGQSVTMIPDQAGLLLLRDAQLELEYEGMFAWYNVNGQSVSLKAGIPNGQLGITRQYHIGIVTEDWDYCPIKIDPVDGESLLDHNHPGYIFVRNDLQFLGTVYKKALYKEFTDDTFSVQKNRTADEEHLGALGPFIRGNVGDTIEIVLKNFDTTHSYNLVPRNLVFSDGSSITGAPSTGSLAVKTYSYFIPERSGPTADQPNCVGSIYTSRTNALNDPYSGLIGPLVICKAGTLDSSGQRKDDVDKEFAAGFIIYNENLSTLKEDNFQNISPTDQNEGDFIESNLYHSINGYLYGNQPTPEFNEGDHVAWYIFGFGAVEDIHTVHFHGQLYLRKTTVTTRRDVTELFAGTYETVEMLGYNPGTWLYHCHLAEHPVEGMESAYTVHPSASRRRRSSSLTSMRRQNREKRLHNRQQGQLLLQ